MAPAVEVARDGDVVRCTLARPPLNLFDPDLIAGVHETFAALAADDGIRVAVLTGSGRAFTAGMNVRILASLDVGSAKALITSLHEAIEAVHHAPFPVIAAINGPCLGAGFELALACDLRVAAAGALLGLPEVRVGLPSVIEAALLAPMVGPGRAAQLLLTGEPVAAEEALGWGLVNRVVPLAGLEGAVAAVIASLRACAPGALRLQKELILRWRYTDLASAIHHGINAFAAGYASGEPQEGARAFLDKRPARFGSPR
ncbi:MAG: enoyl-CoA hydratase/isomerase family protein [Candidatus Rokubacteria bacterium]|nr:enoyl-CoA hydratase/isomerase family protein [Candidatus Rokubacteria bacterium]MBI3825806.1 enoyl-CoA hydratase/isomerase family protein [Candidatus Rokubacteria bacterium]